MNKVFNGSLKTFRIFSSNSNFIKALVNSPAVIKKVRI